MSKGSGGTRNTSKAHINDSQRYVLNDVKIALITNAQKNISTMTSNAFQLGFVDAAQSLIDSVAEKNLGFASDVAKTVKQNRYRISEKQAYVIARSALENNLISKLNKRDRFLFEPTK